MKAYKQGLYALCGELEIADESTFNQTLLESGVYKCTEGLFDVRESGAKCISADDCDDFLLPYSSSCGSSCDSYTLLNGSKKLCIGAWEAKN